MKILLDYVFPITVISPTPAASTAFLKQVCVVAKPATGQEGNVGQVFQCNNMEAVAVRTDNTNAQQLFDAGMSRVFVLLATDLDLAEALAAHLNEFFTVLISDDFDDADITEVVTTPAVASTLTVGDLTFTAKVPGEDGDLITIALTNDVSAGEEVAHAVGTDIVVKIEDGVSTAQQIVDAIEDSISCSALVSVAIATGEEDTAQDAVVETPLDGGADAVTEEGTGLQIGAFKGVVGVSSADTEVCADQAAIANRNAFFTSEANGAKNMFYAFGSLLSNALNWLNQQYIPMPFDDGVDELGAANALFDDKVSFVMNDDEFGNRLALFAVGGKAIVQPYIIKNLSIDLQSRALQWIASNEPQYTLKEASLLEARLQEDVINSFITKKWIEAGTVEITLEDDNFVASGDINVSEPKALWRVFSEMRQTL